MWHINTDWISKCGDFNISTMSWIETYVVSPLVDVGAHRYTRRPLSVQSSALLLAPLFCYYLTAVLVILPRTFLLRLAILPITLFYAFRASIQLDIAAGCSGDPRLTYLNQNFLVRNNFLALSHAWSSLFTVDSCQWPSSPCELSYGHSNGTPTNALTDPAMSLWPTLKYCSMLLISFSTSEA